MLLTVITNGLGVVKINLMSSVDFSMLAD